MTIQLLPRPLLSSWLATPPLPPQTTLRTRRLPVQTLLRVGPALVVVCWPSGPLCFSFHWSGPFGPSVLLPLPVRTPLLPLCLTACLLLSPQPAPYLLPSGPGPPGGRACTLRGGTHPRCLLSALSRCYPGACVKDITPTALQLIQQHSSASAVIVQAGTNDIKYQQSEILKGDFMGLVDSLLDTGKQIIISGCPLILVT